MSPAPVDWAADDVEGEHLAQRQPRMFAGFRLTSIAIVAAFLVLIFWNAWSTRKIMALEQRQVVTVSLQSLISDFITSEARRSGNQDEAAFKTKLYLAAVEKAVADLGADGTPILVAEAVLGNSVTDATPRVKAAVDKAMGLPAGPAANSPLSRAPVPVPGPLAPVPAAPAAPPVIGAGDDQR